MSRLIYISGTVFNLFYKKVSINGFCTIKLNFICALSVYWTSRTFFGQVRFSHLVVPGQVSKFFISTPLIAYQPVKCDVNNDVKLFPTAYCRIYTVTHV